MPRFILLALFTALFIISAVLGVLPAYDPALSQAALTAILASGVLYTVVVLLARTPLTAQVVAWGLLAAGALLSLIFITQFGYQNYGEMPSELRRLGERSTLLPNLNLFYLHPNAVSTFLEVLIPLSIAALAVFRRGLPRLLLVASIILMLYALLLTFSRGSWVALLAALALALALTTLFHMPRRRAWALVMIGGLGLAGGAAALVVLGPDRLPFLSSTFETAASRLTLYRNSLYLGSDYAFTGLGLGDTFAMVYSRYSLLIFVPFLTYSHNLPLAVWLGQGLLGIIALAGIIVTFYAMVARVICRARPSPLFHGAWLGVTATLLHGLTDARQYVEGPWAMTILFVMIAFTAALGQMALDDAFADEPRLLLRLAVVPGGLALLGLAVFILFNAPVRALWNTNLGAINETRADSFIAPDLPAAERSSLTASAIAWYESALAIVPDQPNASRRLGNLYVALERFEEAVPLLETAFAAEPANPAAIKGLGLAYVWTGRVEDAARTLARLDNRRDMVNELYTWSTFRGEQGHADLAAYAREAADLLSAQ